MSCIKRIISYCSNRTLTVLVPGLVHAFRHVKILSMKEVPQLRVGLPSPYAYVHAYQCVPSRVHRVCGCSDISDRVKNTLNSNFQSRTTTCNEFHNYKIIALS